MSAGLTMHLMATGAFARSDEATALLPAWLITMGSALEIRAATIETGRSAVVAKVVVFAATEDVLPTDPERSLCLATVLRLDGPAVVEATELVLLAIAVLGAALAPPSRACLRVCTCSRIRVHSLMSPNCRNSLQLLSEEGSSEAGGAPEELGV